MAVGLGFDVHPFDDSRPLILGGVEIADSPGLLGNSDGDVVMHAITDALLGAIGDDDIGVLFPEEDKSIQGADSSMFVREAVVHLQNANCYVVNVDCVIALEKPKIVPYREQMCKNLSSLINAPVHIKGKRAEGLGFVGRQEGVACWAIAQVEKVES